MTDFRLWIDAVLRLFGWERDCAKKRIAPKNLEKHFFDAWGIAPIILLGYLSLLEKMLYLCSVNENKWNMEQQTIKRTGVIYARVSTTHQNCDRQIQDLTAFAQANNIEIAENGIFEEKISGAARNGERKELMKCLKFAKEHAIDVILVSELSRLGRNVMEVLETVKYCADNRINVQFQKESFSILDADGELSMFTPVYISCLGVAAKLERENIKFRLDSGYKRFLASARENKEHVGRPFGSKISKEKKEREYSLALSLLRKGYSCANVAAICEKRGKGVSQRTLQRLKRDFGIKPQREAKEA